MLGHADGVITMRVYAHALPSGQEVALAVWDHVAMTQ
jgi:hypothetical protein